MTIQKLLFHQAISLFGPFLFDSDCSVLHFSTPLREKCSNTEFFLVRIFPHLDWIFSPNAGKYRLAKTPYLDTFHAVLTLSTHVFPKMNWLGIHFFYRKKWSFLAKDISTNYNTFYCCNKFLCQDQAIKLKGESCQLTKFMNSNNKLFLLFWSIIFRFFPRIYNILFLHSFRTWKLLCNH